MKISLLLAKPPARTDFDGKFIVGVLMFTFFCRHSHGKEWLRVSGSMEGREDTTMHDLRGRDTKNSGTHYHVFRRKNRWFTPAHAAQLVDRDPPIQTDNVVGDPIAIHCK